MQGGVACVVILGNVPDICTSSLYIYIYALVLTSHLIGRVVHACG